MENKSIFTFAKWQVKNGQIRTVLRLVTELAEKSRAEAGNRLYDLYQSESDPNILMLLEEYESQKALDEHRNSRHYQILLTNEILPLLEKREITLLRQIPPQ